jgi:hypothetical protein
MVFGRVAFANCVAIHGFSRVVTPRKKVAPKPPTAGQRLVEELKREDDPYSLQFQIEHAGHTADYLDRLSVLLNGDRGTWLEVKIGAKTVEVVVTDVLRQYRQTAEQLRKLIAAIHSQRALIPSDDGDPDPTDV